MPTFHVSPFLLYPYPPLIIPTFFTLLHLCLLHLAQLKLAINHQPHFHKSHLTSQLSIKYSHCFTSPTSSDKTTSSPYLPTTQPFLPKSSYHVTVFTIYFQPTDVKLNCSFHSFFQPKPLPNAIAIQHMYVQNHGHHCFVFQSKSKPSFLANTYFSSAYQSFNTTSCNTHYFTSLLHPILFLSCNIILCTNNCTFLPLLSALQTTIQLLHFQSHFQASTL